MNGRKAEDGNKKRKEIEEQMKKEKGEKNNKRDLVEEEGAEILAKIEDKGLLLRKNKGIEVKLLKENKSKKLVERKM